MGAASSGMLKGRTGESVVSLFCILDGDGNGLVLELIKVSSGVSAV
jgi:hypothetical protein